MTKKLDPTIKEARAEERIKVEIENLKSINKKLLRANGFIYEDALDAIKKVLENEKLIPQIEFKQEPINKKEHSEIACLLVGDWHLGERVTKEQTNGAANYNVFVCANRVFELIKATKQILEYHQKIYKLEKLVIPLLGDFVSGSIQPELVLSNELSDAYSTILVTRLLGFLINELKLLNIPIQLECVTGNHGRIEDKKQPTKNITARNWDWVIYETLVTLFSNDPQIKINVHTEQMAHVKLFNWKYIIEHGYGVKSGKEEDLESRLRALYDDGTYREMTGLKGSSFDCVVMGHLHRGKFLERIIVNPSLIGITELMNAWRLKPVRAGQTLFGVSRKHLRTWTYPIDLTHIQDSQTTNYISRSVKEYMRKYGR